MSVTATLRCATSGNCILRTPPSGPVIPLSARSSGLVSQYLRLWDYASAARVDEFVANSQNVRRRILKTYRREAEVVYPPVAVETFIICPAEDYFLMVSELVAYKQLDSAVRVLSRAGRRLRIAGDGPEYRRLRGIAGPTVEFCGRVSDAELRDLYARCRALLMPGEEDFGITAVEALASGKPVIAYARGGALESVPRTDPFGGVFCDEPSDRGLEAAIRTFDSLVERIDPVALQSWAAKFSEAEFRLGMGRILEVR